ncbi:glycosyltransferase family 4 protein [Thalassolituus sp.]|uniref:glycosyltransferase family 4 protein n=1 Tax=Thalassolituus sp. TaxID=2030822 RepID=UPI003510E9C0
MTVQHLCVVTETYLPEVNGVANSLQRLISHLSPEAFRTSLIRTTPRTDYPAQGHELRLRGVTIPQYPELQLGLPAYRKIRRFWEQDRPDIVYVATEGLMGASAVAVARTMGIPVVSAFHTNFHHYSGYYGLSWIKSTVMAWMRRFHNRTAMTLVPSRVMVRELQEAGITNVSCLPHGVDCHTFNPAHRSAQLRQQWQCQPGEQVALYVGRLAAEKNIRVAMEAADELRRQGRKIRMVVVGDGPQRDALETEFPDAIFMGVQTGEALSQCFASADIFLMPSKTETFGLVTLEAMASGLPVVAYPLAAAAECVRQGVDGVLAEGLESRDFSHALVAALRLDTTLMGLDARAQAETMSWESVASRFENFAAVLMRSQHHDDMVQALQNSH